MQDVQVFRNGFNKLSVARDGPHQFNIIFVHGLRGHPRRTWEDSPEAGSENTTTSHRKTLRSLFKSKSSSSTANENIKEDSTKLFWPKDYLVEDVPEATVWTYGYNADAIGGLFQANNKNSISQHGRDFAVKLGREVDNEVGTMLLGGIIVKDAMHRSEICSARTKLIVFLGTPHRGSSLAGWAQIASNLARVALQDSNKKLTGMLEVNSEVLDNIHENFKTIAHRSGIKIHSFQEARGISGIKGLHNKVVDDYSSKLDLPQSVETVESIDANHMQMARCKGKDDPRYGAIVGVLKQFMRSGALTEGRTFSASNAAIDRAIQPCHYIPLPINKRFTGRSDILASLRDALFVQKECQRVALFGLGGVGKTQVALQLAYWAKENRPECSIFWVPVLSHATFEQAYLEMAKKLPIQTSSEDEDPKEQVRQYLSSEAAGPWLLVIDNADDMDILFGPRGICDYLPESEDGLTLFTTRTREVAVDIAQTEVFPLDEMDPDDATVLLKESLIGKDLMNDKAVKELLEELTYLPLAITQAAAYLNKNQVSLEHYLELLRGTERGMVSLLSREFRDRSRYSGSQNAVATTWLVSFDQIRKFDSVAADLLAFMSCIEPKAIPRSILPDMGSEEQMTHAIGTLRGYAFVVKRDEEVFDMHSLVHLAIRTWLQKEGSTVHITERAICHLAEVFPSDEWENRSLWRAYLPHAFRVLQENEGTDIEAMYDLFYWAGRCLAVDGRIKEAMSCLEQCFAWRKAHFAEDSPGLLSSQHALAQAYKNNGEVGKALQLLEHVVAVRETLAEDDPNRLASQHELAVVYLADGQVDKALQLLEHVVAVRETLAEDDPNRLASQHELAGVYLADGQVDKALQLLENIVAVEERLAEDNPNRLASQHELARAYQNNGELEKALQLLEHVVAVRETLAEDDPNRLSSQHELARAYQNNGELEKALQLLEHVVAVRETLAEDDPNRLSSQHTLAVVYLDDGQVDKAIGLLKEVVEIEGTKLAEDDPSRLVSQRVLIEAYEANGELDKAGELKQACSISDAQLDQGGSEAGST
ncbi:hypothetical protein N0V82_010123 [Gnomoniopsis sp. IMI 355080]|nr:hypothetical protein N0V82_010123 [Gnomoniopsis sp. IMI 355080]